MDLDTRQKYYEQQLDTRVMGVIPMLARIDGRAFHSWTRGLKRPFDYRMIGLMQDVTKHLAEYTNADVAYTQSDEISLCWKEPNPESLFWAGRIQKIVSDLAATATAYFNALVMTELEEKMGVLATFDARVWNVPNLDEAANYFLWRELDATKNSIAMAAQSVYSHNQLMGKHGSDMQEMLFQKGINWNDYPVHFKRGTFFLRYEVHRPFTTDEIDKLPPKHAARTDPCLVVARHEYREAGIEMHKLSHEQRKEELFTEWVLTS